MASTQANVPLLHRFLGIGLVLLLGAVIGLTLVGLVPRLPPDEVTPVMAYGFPGIAAVLATVGFFVLKPRVPERTPGQSVDAYWSDQVVTAKALRVWFLIEGGAMLAIVGYFLTGGPVTALTAGLTVAAFWLCGPNAFAKP
jgi:hypothetical protein